MEDVGGLLSARRPAESMGHSLSFSPLGPEAPEVGFSVSLESKAGWPGG